jgi:hypothetical protein
MQLRGKSGKTQLKKTFLKKMQIKSLTVDSNVTFENLKLCQD